MIRNTRLMEEPSHDFDVGLAIIHERLRFDTIIREVIKNNIRTVTAPVCEPPPVSPT